MSSNEHSFKKEYTEPSHHCINVFLKTYITNPPCQVSLACVAHRWVECVRVRGTLWWRSRRWTARPGWDRCHQRWASPRHTAAAGTWWRWGCTELWASTKLTKSRRRRYTKEEETSAYQLALTMLCEVKIYYLICSERHRTVKAKAPSHPPTTPSTWVWQEKKKIEETYNMKKHVTIWNFFL